MLKYFFIPFFIIFLIHILCLSSFKSLSDYEINIPIVYLQILYILFVFLYIYKNGTMYNFKNFGKNYKHTRIISMAAFNHNGNSVFGLYNPETENYKII